MEGTTGVVDTFRTLVVLPMAEALQRLWSFVPSILGALAILLIGGVLARWLERIIVTGLKLVRLDKFSDDVQLSTVLARGGIRRKLSELIGVIFYWIVMLAILMTALDALNLPIAADLIGEAVGFLPQVIAAVFIVVIGIFAAAFLGATVRTAASNAGVLQAQLLGQLTQVLVVLFASVAALKQLKIQFVSDVFLIILGGVSLACGLAFGLGCKDIAKQWVADLIDQVSAKKK